MRKRLNIRHWLFAFLFLLLCLPALQHVTGIVNSGKLQGSRHIAPDTAFTLSGWWDGSYQELKTAYLNDNTGFHQDFVRFNNQVDYSLFHKMHAGGIVAGTNGHFYGKEYLDSYCGRDYVPDSIMSVKLNKLKYIANVLESRGKQLLLIYAPSQARYFPDDFPEEWRGTATGCSNYETIRRMAAELGIQSFDANGWLSGMRKTATCALMSPVGIHWTSFGTMVAADSLNRRFEAMLRRPTVRMVWRDTAVTRTAHNNDNDIEGLINLIWPVAVYDWCYPGIDFVNDSNIKRPRPVFISDSFFWSFISNGVPQNCYDNWEFWHYFQESWNNDIIAGKGQVEQIKSKDWMASLDSCDVLVIMATEINLPNLGYGFIEQCYDKFKAQEAATKEL